MGRYLLDTNILVFFILGDADQLSEDIKAIFSDYNNQLFTNSLCMIELLQLVRTGKIKNKRYKILQQLHKAIEDVFFVKILPFTTQHTKTLSQLYLARNHNDPFDHAIIAHAINEKLTLVSSDRKFQHYTTQGLDFVFNKR